ncbi:hypothetical protein [Holospora curviuscula]|uniref:hypothetical protein n=1 Tax=Holospora curviuscula TaxID=1082868 RepID=UPI001A9C75C6|nr:hypothetical protein [Holospora curviuscula]
MTKVDFAESMPPIYRDITKNGALMVMIREEKAALMVLMYSFTHIKKRQYGNI